MPLPNNPKMVWPPESLQAVYAGYREHDAWYSGDPNRLAAVYSSMVHTPTPRGRHWAKSLYDERRTMLHVPLAGDIAGTSADLLFSEPPKIVIPEAHAEKAASDTKAAQERLNVIIQEGDVYSRLMEAAETDAALGDVYIKPTWDREIAPFPILSIAQADQAVPEFVFGMLVAVTFWRCVEADDGIRWLHLERHEVQDGKTVILNGLYKGRDDGELGMRVALTAHAATAHLDDEIYTEVPGLNVQHVPNMKPNRRHRGLALGQSDYAGSEGLLDALDEVYTSWLRDIRLGQGCLVVPESWLEKREDGSMGFDVDREIFTTLDVDPINAQGLGLTSAQFDVRTEEHKNTALELLDRVIASAGYSPQTFGLKIEGRAESGTALNIRERRSFITKAKKEGFWRPAIEKAVRNLLYIDRVHLGGRVNPEGLGISVTFQDSLTQDVHQMSGTVELLSRAQAASVQTKVRMLHPDWSKEEVDAEVKAIMEENSISMPQPDENLDV